MVFDTAQLDSCLIDECANETAQRSPQHFAVQEGKVYWLPASTGADVDMHCVLERQLEPSMYTHMATYGCIRGVSFFLLKCLPKPKVKTRYNSLLMTGYKCGRATQKR